MNFDNVIGVRKDKTIYRDNGKCIKVFNNEYSEEDVLNEALNQARIEHTGLNIPKVLEVTRIGDKWAIVSEFISGKTLAQLMEEEPDKKEFYFEMFVDLQILVQSKSCPRLNRLNDKMDMKISMTDLDAVTRYDLHARLENITRHNKVCHGDFNPSNVILTEEGTPYIIDWSHVTQGNAAADVARTYLLFVLKDEKETAEKYLTMFCEKTNTEKEYVLKWLPIVAASQSVKGNEKERELLLSMVKDPQY